MVLLIEYTLAIFSFSIIFWMDGMRKLATLGSGGGLVPVMKAWHMFWIFETLPPKAMMRAIIFIVKILRK